MKMAARHRYRGFSLLEVMVAVSILAIGFTAIYSLFSQSVAASDVARFRQKAAALAVLKASEWQGKVEEISADEGDFGDEYPGWHWKVTPEALKSKEHESLMKRLKRVRLEVFHNGNTGRYEVVHYLMVEPK